MQIRVPRPVPDGLTVIETMRAEPDGSIRYRHLHLARLRRDCAAVGFPLDEVTVAASLGLLPKGRTQRIRLTVDGYGRALVTHQPLEVNAPLWTVAVSDTVLNSGDPWLRLKTSNRQVFDAARKAMPNGCDEMLFLNERGEVCEGSITNIFLRRRKDGKLLTPADGCGLLPGVLRQFLLDNGQAEQAILRASDLSKGDLYCGNALRGLIPARLMHGVRM